MQDVDDFSLCIKALQVPQASASAAEHVKLIKLYNLYLFKKKKYLTKNNGKTSKFHQNQDI